MSFARVKAAHVRLTFDNVVSTGPNELSRRKGHNYLTVFAELLQNNWFCCVNKNLNKKFSDDKNCYSRWCKATIYQSISGLKKNP